MSHFLEPRSDNDYGECEDNGALSSPGCLAVLLFPFAFVGILFISLRPVLALVVYFIADVGSTLKRTVQSGELAYPFLAQAGAVLALVCVLKLAETCKVGQT